MGGVFLHRQSHLVKLCTKWRRGRRHSGRDSFRNRWFNACLAVGRLLLSKTSKRPMKSAKAACFEGTIFPSGNWLVTCFSDERDCAPAGQFSFHPPCLSLVRYLSLDAPVACDNILEGKSPKLFSISARCSKFSWVPKRSSPV